MRAILVLITLVSAAIGYEVCSQVDYIPSQVPRIHSLSSQVLYFRNQNQLLLGFKAPFGGIPKQQTERLTNYILDNIFSMLGEDLLYANMTSKVAPD